MTSVPAPGGPGPDRVTKPASNPLYGMHRSALTSPARASVITIEGEGTR
jgi:hypothetical protein